MTPSFWLALAFYLIAGAWTWFWVRPRMNRMLELTEKAIAGSERASILFSDLIREAKRIAPPDRVEKLLAAVEKFAPRSDTETRVVSPLPTRREGETVDEWRSRLMKEDLMASARGMKDFVSPIPKTAAAPPLPPAGELGEPPEFGE